MIMYIICEGRNGNGKLKNKYGIKGKEGYNM